MKVELHGLLKSTFIRCCKAESEDMFEEGFGFIF